MAGAAVRVVGFNELRKECRRLEEPKTWAKEFAGINRGIAKDLEPKAQALQRSLGPQQRHFAGAIRGYGSAASARLGIASASKGQKNWGANAATWGVLDNITGRNKGTTPNLKVPWVGNSWDIELGQGPTAIVDTVVRETPRIIDRFGDGVDHLTRRAFPN